MKKLVYAMLLLLFASVSFATITPTMDLYKGAYDRLYFDIIGTNQFTNMLVQFKCTNATLDWTDVPFTSYKSLDGIYTITPKMYDDPDGNYILFYEGKFSTSSNPPKFTAFGRLDWTKTAEPAKIEVVALRSFTLGTRGIVDNEVIDTLYLPEISTSVIFGIFTIFFMIGRRQNAN